MKCDIELMYYMDLNVLLYYLGCETVWSSSADQNKQSY